MTVKSPSRRKNHLRPRTAFSLIELLVSIVIIGILAAVLFPLMRGARTRTLGAVSAANLRQCGSYLLMNAVENDNKISLKAGGSGGSSKLWASVVADMVAPGMGAKITNQKLRVPSLDIMYCPTFFPYKHDPVNSNWTWATYGLCALPIGDYSKTETVEEGSGKYSLYVVDMAGGAEGDMGNHPLLMDSISMSMDPPSQRMSIITRKAGSGVVSPHMRHGGRARAVFLDGSVRELDEVSLRELGFTGAISEGLELVKF